MNKEKTYSTVQTVDRAMLILDVFIRENRQLTLPEIANAIDLHKSVVHRLITTMVAHHLLEKVTDTGKFRVGSKAIELSAVYMNSHLIDVGKRFLRDLTLETGEMAHMAILNQGKLLYVVNQRSPNSLLVHAPVGMRNPINTTALGKVLLAWMDEDQALEILQSQKMEVRTPQSISTIEAFMTALHSVREKGYALDDEEMSVGHRCISAPVRDHTREVVAAISVTGSIQVISDEVISNMADKVKNYAGAISERLGFRALEHM